MEEVNVFGWANWIGILSTTFTILCFYFSLTFFQHLKSDNERMINQSKLAAVICLALALLVPAIYNLYILTR
ncbi:hypothetical protein [Bacillus sp. FJAT-42315]|uniref:hypothetical protein n=1 Tax=Bacillus sp. FJAT-42315 TaxID=2014077 RepID=UPI000C23D18C|nr:hypothetical protein [Bacillus sp. FJAT-42315]